MTALSTLRFLQFVDKSDGNRQVALRALVSHVENELPLCPVHFKSEPNNVQLLRQARISEQWAHQLLSRITTETKFRILYDELASILQVGDEFCTRAGTHYTGAPSGSSSLDMKQEIYFPSYGRKITRKFFGGNE